MNYLYNFVVFHQDNPQYAQYNEGPFHTIYSVESDHAYDDRSFSFVASRILLAERVILFAQTLITHIVVYEITPQKWMDSTTTTHTLLPARDVFGLSVEGVPGARPYRMHDRFFGLRYRVNVEMGKAIDRYIPACVGAEDMFTKQYTQWYNKAIFMNAQGALQRICFPFYANQLAKMPQVKPDLSIDRFGEVTRYEKATGGRMISHISNNLKHRRRRSQPLPKTRYFEWILLEATEQMREGLRTYHKSMNDSDHTWGDDHAPNPYQFQGFIHAAACAWLPIMRALGYNLGDADYSLEESAFTPPEWMTIPEPGTVLWKAHGRQIHDCLTVLFECQQWLKYFWGIGTTPPQYWNQSYTWRDSTIYDDPNYHTLVYNDWDNMTAVCFRACDCINVLNMILTIKETAPPIGAAGPIYYAGVLPYKSTSPTAPSAIPFELMLEIYPIPADPYYETPDPDPPVIDTYTEEVIEFDSGSAEIDWDSGNDSFAYQVSEMIRNLKARAEFIRRWIGKVREQMPWYKGLPMERLLPEQDETKNPLGPEDIPNP